ncbi:MAG: M6 family metalloprotease domain-containing protein [Candidatus Ventricola sp.]
MNTIRRWAALFILLAALCAASGALAVPAFPGLLQLLDEATGETVPGYLCGDEFFSYRTDEQGHVVVTDELGCLRYVIRDGRGYALGGYLIAENGDTAIGGVPALDGDEGLESALRALEQEIEASRPALFDEGDDGYSPLSGAYDYNDPANNDALRGKMKRYSTYPEPEDYTGRQGDSIPLLLIRVNYSDVQCCFTETQWSSQIFDESKGLPAFYRENSDGQFAYRRAAEQGGTANDGVVTAELPIACPKYSSATRALIPGVYHGKDGREYAIGDVPTLFAYAVAAVEDKVDFAAYDTNGDKRIDPTELAIMIALPGLNASVDGWDQADGNPGGWPHSSVIYREWLDARGDTQYDIFRLQVDGVEVYKYTMTVENAGAPATGIAFKDVYDYYTHKGTPVMTPIGTACHELGHDLGLADLYNTGFGSTRQNVNGMSLMSLGSWGYRPGEIPGTTPTHIDPYSKIYLGFYKADKLMADGRYRLAPASDSHQYSILRIPTSDPKVYYLVENRQFSGFDSGLYYESARALRYPQTDFEGGLVIWRIDEHVLRTAWSDNTPNNTDGRYGIMPLSFFDDPQLLTLPTYPSAGSPFLKLGMTPAALTSGHRSITLEPVSRDSDGTITLVVDGYIEPDVPQTGDASRLELWLGLLCACAALLAALGLGRSRLARRRA